MEVTRKRDGYAGGWKGCFYIQWFETLGYTHAEQAAATTIRHYTIARWVVYEHELLMLINRKPANEHFMVLDRDPGYIDEITLV